MATQVKIKKVRARIKPTKNRKIRDFGNDPFFVKKAKESKAFLEKSGFPKELLLKK
jgi:hypothetical protein